MPTITRVQAETILGRRVGGWLTQAGLSGSDPYDDPIAYGLRQLGHSVADPTNPDDADLSALASSELDQFLLLAEVRLLETIRASSLFYDQTLGAVTKKLSQLRDGLNDAIKAKRAELADTYGVGLGSLTGGTIGLDFAESLPESEGY